MKKIISKILQAVGTIMLIVFLAISEFEFNALSLILFAVFLIGGITFIVIGVKLENQLQTARERQTKDYSKEFESLYNKTILYKVNGILKEGE